MECTKTGTTHTIYLMMMWRWCQKSNMRKQWARGCFVTYESKYRTYRGSSNVRWIWDTMTNGIIGTTGRWCWIHHESVQLATAKESLFSFCFAAGWSWLAQSGRKSVKNGKMIVKKFRWKWKRSAGMPITKTLHLWDNFPVWCSFFIVLGSISQCLQR